MLIAGLGPGLNKLAVEMYITLALWSATLWAVGWGQATVLEAISRYYRDAFLAPPDITSDTETFRVEYDFIVVGAGSGGCVVANRLTENPDWSLLLLEAGGDEIFLTDVPLLVSFILGTDYNWGYKTEPQSGYCSAMTEGKCNWPRGKVMGGTSTVNYMVYTRGFKADYDLWESLGNYGWGYESVLPYFKKYENVQVAELKNSQYYSTGGYLNVERPKWRTPLATAFVESGRRLGYPYSEGLTHRGFSYVLATTKRGARHSAAKAFVRPVRDRKNLFVAKRARVTGLLIDAESKRAYGVRFVKNRKTYTIMSRKEVILSAGALNSPQLLMLSGVGPKSHLEELGIPVVADLKVGFNLQDHVSMAGLVFFVNGSYTLTERRLLDPKYFLEYTVDGGGPFALPGGAEALGFVNSSRNPDVNHPDVEFVFGPGALTADSGGSLRLGAGISDAFYDAVYRPHYGKQAFSIVPILLRPNSLGLVRLRSDNPFHWPLLYPNYYSDREDLQTMVEAIKMAIAIGTAEPFRSFDSQLLKARFPGCEPWDFGSDDYWACACRQLTTNLHHQSGTCKMGPDWDPDAVVDPELRVRGVSALRVVDASVMPVVPAGHTNAVVYMIAEKAADMIKAAWSSNNASHFPR